MIRVSFRLDDPSETSHQALEAGIMDILSKHHVPATFAVIPFRMVDGERKALTKNRAQPLIDAAREGVIEVALHGHLHIRRQSEPARPTEFAGRPQDDQHAMIEEGRTHLSQIFDRHVTGFVPPWNSYDLATMISLESLGFRYLSAGWEQPANYQGGLKLLPRTAHLSDIPAALREARRFVKARPVVVVVMHHFDFFESGSDRAAIDMRGFDAALGQILQEPDVQICTLGNLAEEFDAPNTQLRQHHQLMSNAVAQRLLPKRCFLDTPLWRSAITGALHS